MSDDDGTIEFPEKNKAEKTANENKPIINYQVLVAKAHYHIVRGALEAARDNPLLGYYKFYITFDTNHPDVDIPDWVREQYDAVLTIVLNEQYSGLEVEEDYFAVTLYFGGKAADLIIPYGALKSFHDDVQDFTIGFGVMPNLNEKYEKSESETDAGVAELMVDTGEKDTAEVVSLDDFRKKD